MTELTVDAESVAGLLFAMTRVSGVMLGAPQFARRLPIPGRVAMATTLGLFLAVPLPAASMGFGSLISGVTVNMVVGLMLGFASTLIFQMFIVAGGLLDLSSGLGVSAIFDPQAGRSSTVFERTFDLTAMTMFFILGGPHLLVAGISGSLAVVPLAEAPQFSDGIADLVLDTTARFFVAGIEIAAPALAALFLTEIVFGVAARMLPDANIFLLGLPARVLVAIIGASVVLLTFPTYVTGGLSEMQDTLENLLRMM
ncbi:MAG: flagellar biosynthetic protein FliR [Actinomycetia bacterium]|nr:flagellar biosynthetic protein FliR [Actinomycetes bacterium]MCP4960854.1 flagellar biosynthetic protein FliR [Actinomycetes bacterium]